MISSIRLCRQRGSLTPKSVFGVPTWTIVLIQEEPGQRERAVYFSCPGQTLSGWSCLSSGSVRFEVVTAIVERIGLVPVRLLRLPCGGGHLIIESCISEAPLFLESGGIAGLPQTFRCLFWVVSGGIWNRTLHSEMFQLVLSLSLQKGQCQPLLCRVQALLWRLASQCAALPGNGFRGDRYKMNTEMTRLYSVFSYFCRPTWGGMPSPPRTCSSLWFCPFFRTPIGRQSMPNTATDSSTFPGRMGAWSTSTLPRRSADGTVREFTQPWPGSRGGWYVRMWSLVS